MRNSSFKRNVSNKIIIFTLVILIILFIDSNFFIFDRTFEYLYRSCDEIDIVEEYDANSNKLYMYTFDVGQSESILLLYQDTSILIDSGTTDYAYPLTKTLKKLGIDNLDYCIFTHPHYDHMGGSSAVIRTFKPQHLYVTKYDYNSLNKWWFEIYKKTVLLTHMSPEYLEEGSTITIDDLKINIISPLSDSFENLNDYSIGMKVTLDEIDILLLGDSEASAEHDLIESDYELDAEILKVSHHGSTTSSTYEFLYHVKPEYAIISVGKDNPYGHPKQVTLNKLNLIGATVFRTDLDGTILVTTDGKEIEILTTKNQKCN